MDDHASAIIKPTLAEDFRAAWENGRLIFFAAPCGCGKTTTAAALLRGRKVCSLNGADADFSTLSVPDNCEVILVDDLQYVQEPERQQSLCAMIRSLTGLHFVLLSRGRVPGWLLPFQLAGMMQCFDLEALLFDRETSRRMLEARGIAVTPTEMGVIFRDLKGYPLSMRVLCDHLGGNVSYDVTIYDACQRDVFFYLDEAVFHRFEPPLRALLLSLSPFENFHIELAQMVSGEEHAGELLGVIQRDTTMLLFDNLDTYRFRPIFRRFLQWKFNQTMSEADRRGVYSRAALYYELHGEPDRALDCYSRAGEPDRVSALLIKNAEQHPGVGHYREMQDYYFALPREEVLRSPSLICGMSMLTAMCLDYEASEQWYNELARYAACLKKSDPEYRETRGKLAYLDIALPQRGSKSLVSVIDSVFRVMLNKQLKVPSFSVTSTLPSIMNGGKDFCEWSKKDDLLYATMRAPVEAILGRDGVGLADCAICESKFEKGENVSERMLTLMSRLGEIQTRGTADIEFAVMGLLARIQVSQGRAETALESIESLREKYERIGETRFLGNVDALLTRIRLRLGDTEAAEQWLADEAPKNDARLWAMWRYQYQTRAMVQLCTGEAAEALLLLARLEPYCQTCGRIMDGVHIRVLTALCRRQMENETWKAELCTALDISHEYGFVWPVAQYGTAILPLLRTCGWEKSRSFLKKLVEAAQAQAVFYPRFLHPTSQLSEPLTAAEMQVLRLLCRNLSNQEIGEILDIRLATVKSHVSHILQKLGVQNRSEAKEAAEKLRLL